MTQRVYIDRGQWSEHPDQTFPRFWSAYPRRVAKKDAAKAWRELNPSADVIAEILTALEWQRDQWVDLNYCPYPATYLRAERWMDEKPTPKTINPTIEAKLEPWQRKSLLLNWKK